MVVVPTTKLRVGLIALRLFVQTSSVLNITASLAWRPAIVSWCVHRRKEFLEAINFQLILR